MIHLKIFFELYKINVYTKVYWPLFSWFIKINEGLHRRFVPNDKIYLVDRYKDLQDYLKSIVNYDDSLHDYLKL